MADIALLIVGMILGALAFSLVVGRHRARRLARLTDLLAGASVASADVGSIRYPDRVLSSSIQRLQTRIAEVEAKATTDQLTDLLNRLACLQFLTTEIARANRYDRQLAVALIDIDHFKRINDTHGHAAGDEVLRHVARLLTRTFARSTRGPLRRRGVPPRPARDRHRRRRSRPPRASVARLEAGNRRSALPAGTKSRRRSRSASGWQVGTGPRGLGRGPPAAAGRRRPI